MFASTSLARVSENALQILKQRLELAAIDIEEELLRFGLLLVTTMIALLLSSISIVLIAAAVMVYFWDTAKWSALLSMCALFLSLGIIMAFKLCQAIKSKPRFMAATLSELEKDRGIKSREKDA
jgi:uncharacterized membrane protein YqjE